MSRSLKLATLICLFCFPIIWGCQSMSAIVKQPLEEEGELLLYVQPFPQEADRLSFRIEAVSALRSDGEVFPVSLKVKNIKGREMTRQRLLGEVDLPPGAYVGLAFKVTDASLRAETGEAHLLTPETPVRIEFPFRVERKRGDVLWLALRPKDALKTGFSFSPAFFISPPMKPVAGLTGYVTNTGSNDISVFDKGTGQVTGVIATSGAPAGIALDRRNLKAYVALPSADAIEVVDVVSGAVTDRIRATMGDRPRELALAPDGRNLLSVNAGSNTVSFIDTASLAETSRVTVGNGPASVLIDPAGRRAYVFNSLSSTISVIDVANKALAATIGTDPGPLRGQFNGQGDTLYVIHEWSPYVSIIDARTLSVKRTNVGIGLISIKVDTNTNLVYMGRVRDPIVGVYDPNSFVPVDYIQSDGGVAYMTIDGEMNNLLMVCPDVGRLVIANLISKKTLSVIDVGETPYQVAVMGER